MGLNILIVDDSSLTRKAIRRIIDMIDLDAELTLEAEDGQKALEVIAENHIDLVLADLNMPIMDGMEMIFHLRGDEKTKSIPVVIVSTESSTARVEKLLADGVNNYLHKPFTPEKLKDIITQTIGV
jgi:two-component system chemotaxis response regulator CheY